MLWPSPLLFDERFWVVLATVAAIQVIGFLCWTRWRRLTWPDTPSNRDDVRRLLDAMPDAFERRAAVAASSAVYDSTLRSSLRRAARRFEAAAAHLAAALVRYESALHHHLEAGIPSPPTVRRRLVAPWVALAAVPLVALSDFAFGWVVFQTAFRDAVPALAAALAVTITIGYLALGRFIAHAFLRGRPALAIVAAAFAVTLAHLMTGLQHADRHALLAVAVVPTVVSTLLTVLAHPGTEDDEVRHTSIRDRDRAFRRQLRRVERRLAAAGRREAHLRHLASRDLVIRPLATSLGEPSWVGSIDVTAALERLGLSEALGVTADAHDLLRRSRTLLAPSTQRPRLVAAADSPNASRTHHLPFESEHVA